MDKWIIHKDEIVYNGRIICHMEKRVGQSKLDEIELKNSD